MRWRLWSHWAAQFIPIDSSQLVTLVVFFFFVPINDTNNIQRPSLMFCTSSSVHAAAIVCPLSAAATHVFLLVQS